MCIDCTRMSLYIGNAKNLFRNEIFEIFGRKELYLGYTPVPEKSEFLVFGDSKGGCLGNGETNIT